MNPEISPKSRAFASRSPGALAAQATAACGGCPPRPASGRRRAFTLIEIMACMGIFALGFAAIAMMLPAGSVMQRDIEARGFGDIIGRNALEIVKGKGANALTYDVAGQTSFALTPVALNSGFANFADFGDMEGIVRQSNNESWLFQGYGDDGKSGPDTMWKYFNTKDANGWMQGTANGARCVIVWGNPDLTHCGLGRIHALSRRPIPGRSLGMYSILDFSYPSTIFDVQARSYFAHVLRTNQCTTMLGTGNWWPIISLPSKHNWQLTVVTTRSNSGDEWPEQAEADVTNGDPGVPPQRLTASPSDLQSNTPMNLRSKAGDSTLMAGGVAGPGGTGMPDSAALNRWPYWNPPVGSGTGTYGYGNSYDSTVTPYGGSPNAANPMIRGWGVQMTGDNTGGIGTSWMSMYNSPGWGFLMNYATPPVGDRNTLMPGRTTYKYLYSIPNVQSIYAIVYDRDNDLLLVRYPQVFASNPVTGNGRTDNFWKDMNADHTSTVPTPYVDRKLKVGDSFLGAYGAIPFKVKELVDPVSEFNALPAVLKAGVTDGWADGTYQIIRVTPSLSTTGYTGNKPMSPQLSWTEPSPIAVWFAPPPLAGGPSPWVSTVQLNNCNSTIFRDWNNLTD